MKNNRLQLLLDKFFSGEATEEEKALLDKWYEAFDEKPVANYLKENPEDKERLRMEMRQSLGEKINRSAGQNRIIHRNKKTYRKIWLYTAAACLVTLLVGTWVGYHLSGMTSDAAPRFITTQTSKGERSLVMLSDGSKVYLNSESKLVYPIKNQKDGSEVYLVGEAYFIVADDTRPLVVNTSGISTTVDASDCNISAFPEDSIITIAVQKGEARISSNDETHPMLSLRMPKKEERPKTVPMAKLVPAHPTFMKLIPVKQAKAESDEFITYNKKKKTIDINDSLNTRALLGWKDGIMYFHEANTTELINRLERWYGVSVTLNTNGMALPKFTGEFDNESLNSVLEHISDRFDLNYTVAGKNVYLNKRMD